MNSFNASECMMKKLIFEAERETQINPKKCFDLEVFPLGAIKYSG